MKTYLDPVAVSRLQNMQIRARLVVEGYFAGMHKSPLKGRSTDFADYRRYTQGDDLKHIDWKVYAKVDRYYVKEFEEHTSMSVWLLLDTSNSMEYGSQGVSKLQYGCFLAGALMYLMVKQQDNVGLVTFSDRTHSEFPPRRSANHLNHLLSHLEELVPKGESRIASTLEGLTGRLKRRGLIVLISDLLDDPEQTLQVLKRLRGMKNEVLVFHVLDRDELEFPFSQLMEFEDLETGARKKIDCEAVRREYLKRLRRFLSHFENECPRFQIDYVRASTADTFHEVLTRYLLKRNQIPR